MLFRRTNVTHAQPIGVALLLAISASLFASPVSAGPWTKSAGEVYLQTGERLFVADSFVNPSGQLVSDVEYLGASSFLYFEVGIAERLQVQGYLPYTVAINTYGDGWRYMHGGWGDATVGVQWAPISGQLLALRADAKIPMYDVDGYSGLYEENLPALGSGNVDSTLWASYGGMLPDTQIYLFAEAGYRLRTELFVGGTPDQDLAFADGFVFNTQIGGALSNHFSLAMSVSGLIPFEDDGVSEGNINVGQSFFAPIRNGWAVVGGVEQSVWARNGSRGFGVNLGVAFSM